MPGPPDIHAALDAIEVEERVTILFAVESGSRAWGFPGAARLAGTCQPPLLP